MGSNLIADVIDEVFAGRRVDDNGTVIKDWVCDHLATDQAGRVWADSELVAYARRHSIGIPRSPEHAPFSTFQALTEAQKAVRPPGGRLGRGGGPALEIGEDSSL